MAKDDFKGLFAKLKTAAVGIKAEIAEIDNRVSVLQAEREVLTDASVSKEDFMTYVREDIARRGQLYVHRIKGFAKGNARGNAKLNPSFSHLEHAFQNNRLQGFPFMNGEDAFDGFNPSADAFYWYFGDLIAERFCAALDLVHDWPTSSIPVEERRKQIAAIDDELDSLIEKRDSLAAELINAGMVDS